MCFLHSNYHVPSYFDDFLVEDVLVVVCVVVVVFDLGVLVEVVAVVVIGATYLTFKFFTLLPVPVGHCPSVKPLFNIHEVAASGTLVVVRTPPIFLQKVRVLISLFFNVLTAFFPSSSTHTPLY